MTITDIVHGVPSRRLDRWPLLVVAFGWTLLAGLTFANLVPGKQSNVWGIIALLLAAATVAFWAQGGNRLRKISAAGTIAFGVVRSAAYAADGIFSPVAVWCLVAGLAVMAYRTSRRQDA